MGSFLLYIFTTITLFLSLISCFSCRNIITPNFKATNLQFVEDHGAFLYSQNNTFKAAIYNPGNEETKFYLCVIHVVSQTVIWAANRNDPISNSGQMKLSINGLLISDENGNQKWSTPRLHSPVSAMVLTEVGNLVLLDKNNDSVWESFDCPSDTIVIGQHLQAGILLTNSLSDNDLSSGNYSLLVRENDVILQWYGSTYWKLSMEHIANLNSNYVAEYLVLDEKGVYLFGHNGSVVVLQANIPSSDFRIAKVDTRGQFIVQSFSGTGWKQDFVGPDNRCKIPYVCGRIGLCATDAASNGPCSCPTGFRAGGQQSGGCVPSDGSFSLPLACNSSKNQVLVNTQNFSYLGLGVGKSYFGSTFLNPDKYGIELSACQKFCSAECSCLGVFYNNLSGTCLMIRNQLGSIMWNVPGGSNQLGYIKTVVSPDSDGNNNGNRSGSRKRLSVVALVILPVIGLVLVAVVGLIGWRRWKKSKVGLDKFGYPDSPSSGEMEAFSIPGLPVRYDYEELKTATDNFRTQIGSGGFGTVYKGVLPDRTVVAVKKITNLGVQGKRDFCTEIAVIGSVHHVNLVRLKGFCAQGKQRLLVYEYMNHGSLDRTLFGNGPVLEWQERFDIALGTARGLAYLHTGCEQKIIHCDVKPENILLHDQFKPKISDFGLSKLLNPEQSSHFTTMRGTRGYLAPEWLTSSAISEKTDVYSYGMVLLELVSGRKNCSPRQQSHSLDDNNSTGNSSRSSGTGLVYFPMFALEMHEQGRYLDLADLRLEGRVTSEEIEKLVLIALCCVHEEPSLRPNMVTIVGMLQDRIQLSLPRLESLNFLRYYGRRFAEPSVLGSGDQHNEFMVYHQHHTSAFNMTGAVQSSCSYVSSQDVSGPR